MKLSKYLIYKWTKNSLIIYNTFNKSILLLNKKNGDLFVNKIIKEDFNVPKDIINFLIREGIIYEDDNFSEIDILKSIDYENRNKIEELYLTIALTTKCNFSCIYCYEKEIKKEDITKNVIDKIIDYIYDNMKDIQKLKITWYGGEPLLKIQEMEYFFHKIIPLLNEKKIIYESSIITNGYLLNKKIIEKLKEIKVTHLQITVDGIKELHDVRRFLANKKGTFDIIMKNIKYAKREFNIALRINLDKKIYENFDEFLNYLEEKNLKKYISIYISFAKDYFGNNIHYFNKLEYYRVESEIIEKIINRDFKYAYDILSGSGVCPAPYKKNLIISSDGNIYKCPLHIGNINEAIGEIKSFKNYENTKWYFYDPFKDEECVNCEVFPLCITGCHDKKMKESERNCPSIKYNIKKYLEIIYKGMV
ncbi:radical SAM/SPASM domain Clo7bot peptide maturase [Marinitoga arctica]